MFFDEQLQPLPDDHPAAVAAAAAATQPTFPDQGMGGMPLPVHKMSVWERVHQGLNNIASSAKQGFSQIPERMMPTPQGLEGMLTPENIHAARMQGLMGAGQALLSGAGQGHNGAQALASALQGAQQGYGGGINQTIQTAQAVQGMQQQKKILAGRDMIARQYPTIAGEDQHAMNMRLRAMYSDFVRNGDTEMVSKLGEVIKSIEEKPVPTKSVAWEDADDHKEARYAETGLPVLDAAGNPLTIKKGMTSAEVAAQQSRADMENERRRGAINRIKDNFRAEPAVKDYETASSAADLLRASLASPGMASPIMMMDAFGRVNNPHAQVRPSMLELINQMGAFGDKAKRWMSMIQTGQWPAEMTTSVTNSINATMKEHRKSFLDAKNAAINEGKADAFKIDMEPFLPDPERGRVPPGKRDPSKY